MWIENLSYIATFIISAGMAVIGILVSFQLYQVCKKPVLSILLYQQVFLFSFFIYGIWGNMVLREVIGDLNLNPEIASKLAFFIPVIGIPFLLVSWFMLLKFGFNLNGYKVARLFAASYFPGFLIIVFILSFLIHKKILLIPENTDLFIVRIFLVLNLIIHIIFLIPFFITKKSAHLIKETGFSKNWAFYYVGGVMVYSGIMSFFDLFDYVSTCISIIFLFAVSTFIPVRIKLANTIENQSAENIDFNDFCNFYEISKREVEIVAEICAGHSNKAIADKLFITLQTVKDHNHRIFTKTGVKSRVQLANLVREKTGKG